MTVKTTIAITTPKTILKRLRRIGVAAGNGPVLVRNPDRPVEMTLRRPDAAHRVDAPDIDPLNEPSA